MKTIKEIYNLNYDMSGFNSGLIQWYNKLLDKIPNELDIFDVSRMIRQNILVDLAIDKAIDLFFEDPYSGEYQDGGLLSFLVSINLHNIDKEKVEKLRKSIFILREEYINFDWEDNESMQLFIANLNKLEINLSP